METINTEKSVVINVENEVAKPKKITLACFRIGDSSSKAFVIRVSISNQIYSIKEYISRSFEPRIVPRYLKLFVPVENEIFPDSTYLSSIKNFNKARRDGVIKLVELEKPLKKISDEECLCNREKINPEALDIIILDDNLQRSIDNFVSNNSLADISFGSKHNLAGDNNSNLSRDRLFQNNASTSNFLTYESSASLYPNHKNSKLMKSIEKVEKKASIKNKKVRIAVSILAALAIILIVGFTWFPRSIKSN